MITKLKKLMGNSNTLNSKNNLALLNGHFIILIIDTYSSSLYKSIGIHVVYKLTFGSDFFVGLAN